MIEQLLGTSHAKVYDCLAQHIGQSLMESEIVAWTGVSRSAVNLAVRDLTDQGLIERVKRGRTGLYSARVDDPVVRQFKIWRTILSLHPLLCRIGPRVQRVVLFGSAAEGLDRVDSDLDLFVVTADQRAARNAIPETVDSRTIQTVIVSAQELAKLKHEDPAFHTQVRQGIILFERPDGGI